MNTDTDTDKEFEKEWNEIMGLETGPDGTPNMYLIRDGYGDVLNGIDFSEERDKILVFIHRREQEVRKEVVDKIKVFKEANIENNMIGLSATLEVNQVLEELLSALTNETTP